MANDNLDLERVNRQRFYTIRELANASGLPMSSIRAAAREGGLAAVRLKQSCNAPLRIKGYDFIKWIEALAAQSGPVLSPTQAAKANRRAK